MIPDPERATLVRWAFEAYATGNYSTSMLHSELIDRGLTSVPTPKRPAKAPGLSTIQQMLSNPYYKGDVIFRGARYDGLHEPLVSAELWYRVQNVLTAHQVSGEKTQTHEHYLKGSVYCGDCGSRLMVTHAKNGKGIVYPYFICAGRHSKRTNCVRQAMPIEHIERQVEDYYRRVQIPEHIVTALRQMLVRQFDDLHTANKAARQTLAAERDNLRDERRSQLHAHHAGAVPLDLLKEEQDRIARRLVFLDAQIDAGQIEYDQAKAHLEDCLALAGDMHAIYMSIDDSLRRICNQAFFERIHVYEIENADIVTADPGEPFDALLDPNLHAAALAYQASVRAGEDVKPADVASLNIDYWVGLPKRFSNTRPALKTFIRRVLKGSERRGPRSRTPERHDSRGVVAKNAAKSQTRLTPERRAELVADYEAGMPVRMIAAKYAVHRGTVPTLVTKDGARLRTSGLSLTGRAHAASLYAEGLTLREVAERLGVDEKTVRNAVVEERGLIRPRGRRPHEARRDSSA